MTIDDRLFAPAAVRPASLRASSHGSLSNRSRLHFRVLGTWLALAFATALTACGGPPPVDMPQIGFSGPPVLQLEAETPAEVVVDYRAPLTSPHIEHLYRIAPGQIARDWLRSRVALSGNGGEVRLTIHDASVIEKTVEGHGGLFGGGKMHRLVARLDVTLDYLAPDQAAASARATTEVVRDLKNGASERETEIAYFELLKELATAFDVEMKARITDAFRPVLHRPA